MCDCLQVLVCRPSGAGCYVTEDEVLGSCWLGFEGWKSAGSSLRVLFTQHLLTAHLVYPAGFVFLTDLLVPLLTFVIWDGAIGFARKMQSCQYSVGSSGRRAWETTRFQHFRSHRSSESRMWTLELFGDFITAEKVAILLFWTQTCWNSWKLENLALKFFSVAGIIPRMLQTSSCKNRNQAALGKKTQPCFLIIWVYNK